MTNTRIVIDASVLVDLLAGPDDGPLHDVVDPAEWHAPAHVDVEVLHALRGLVLGGHLGRPRAQDALADLHQLTLHRWPLALPLARRAFALADNVTAYDAVYLALAEALGCPLVTRDRRLLRAARNVGLSDAIIV